MTEIKQEDFREYIEDFDTKTDGWTTNWKAFAKALEVENAKLKKEHDDAYRVNIDVLKAKDEEIEKREQQLSDEIKMNGILQKQIFELKTIL